MRVLKIFLGVILCIAAFGWTATAITEKQALWLIGTAVSIFLAVLLFRKTKKDKDKMAAKTKATQKPLRGRFQHVAGLPLPEGVECDVVLSENGLAISSSGNNFTVTIDKITSITTKTDVEVQTHLASSAGGALAGAALFGVPGALIGGRTKEKKTVTRKNYMVVTYNKDNSPTYRLFGFTVGGSAASFIKYFNLLTQNRIKETVVL